jgi:hypothetical protein
LKVGNNKGRQFHQHFTSSFYADILSPKHNKAKLQVEKSFVKHFQFEKAAGECW